MNLRQRCQAVFQAGYSRQKTFRSLAAATNLSKAVNLSLAIAVEAETFRSTELINRHGMLVMHHPATATLSPANLQQWLNWASWMVSKFQRSSSLVEGRNGYLSVFVRDKISRIDSQPPSAFLLSCPALGW